MKNVITFIGIWAVMIISAIFMPVLTLFKFKVSLKIIKINNRRIDI